MSASLYLDFVQVLSFQPQQRTLAIPVSCFGYAEGGNRLVPCGVGQWFPPFAFVLRTHTFPRSGFFSSFTDIFLGKNSDLSKKNPRFRFAIVFGISVSTQKKKKYLNEEDATTQMPWRSSRCTLTFTLSLDINIRSNRLAGWGTLNLTINAEENGRLRNALGAAIHSPLSKLPRNVPKARNLQSWFRLPVANLVAVVKGAGKKIGGTSTQ